METSLAFPSSNPGGDVSDSGLPSTMETTSPLLFLFLNLILPWHGGGMTNLHGISEGHLLGLSFRCINSFHHFIPWGSRRGGQFSILWAGWVIGRLVPWQSGSTSPFTMTLLLPYVLPPPGFTMRSTSLFCHLRPSLISLLDPFSRTMGGGSVVPCYHLGTSALFLCVPSLFILGPTLNSFKERSTGKCYVFPNPIIWNLGPPPSLGTSQYPGDGGQSRLQRAQLLKGSTTSAQKFLTMGAHLSLYRMSVQ